MYFWKYGKETKFDENLSNYVSYGNLRYTYCKKPIYMKICSQYPVRRQGEGAILYLVPKFLWPEGPADTTGESRLPLPIIIKRFAATTNEPVAISLSLHFWAQDVIFWQIFFMSL